MSLTARITFLATEEFKADLQRQADEQKISVGEVVRDYCLANNEDYEKKEAAKLESFKASILDMAGVKKFIKSLSEVDIEAFESSLTDEELELMDKAHQCIKQSLAETKIIQESIQKNLDSYSGRTK